MTCVSANLVHATICSTCKEECIKETRERETKLRAKVRVYRKHLTRKLTTTQA